jgi:hypothetical protein
VPAVIVKPSVRLLKMQTLAGATLPAASRHVVSRLCGR